MNQSVIYLLAYFHCAQRGTVPLMNHSPLVHVGMRVLELLLRGELRSRAWCWEISQGQRARDLNKTCAQRQLIHTQRCLIVLTPAGRGSLRVNTEAVYTPVLLLRMPLGVRLSGSMVAWDPWFHPDKVYLNIQQAAVFGLSRLSNVTAEYWCVYGLHTVWQIRKPI